MENVSKNDFLFFQNDILKDIKKIESTMNTKISQINQTIISKINEHESKISRITDNINELLSIYASRKHDNENIEQLLNMRRTINDSLLDCKTQINLINRSLNNAISKYDSIIVDNLSLPGIVGMNCKFKNFREYLEYIYNELKANNLFKEQQLLNAKRYKEKLENLIKKEEVELLEVTNKTNKICETKFQQYEKIMEDKFNLTQELVQATRMDNSKYACDLIKKTEELTIHYEQLKCIKNEIHDEFEQELSKFRKEVENNTKKFTVNQNDFKLLKQRFTQLSEFIKDVRFQKNLKNFRKMSKAIDFTKKQKYKDNYNMELYDEISKDFLSYINSEKDGDNKSKLKRKSIRPPSVISNKTNKEQIKKSILSKFRKSINLDSSTLDKINKNLNKLSPKKRKRNSMVYQQNEYNEMKKKIIFDNTIKEEESSSLKRRSQVDDPKINNEKDKDDIISFSKSNIKSSSSSSSSSLYSSKSNTSSKKKNKDQSKKEEEKKTDNKLELKIDKIKNLEEQRLDLQQIINNRRASNQIFQTIKIQSKNDSLNNNDKKETSKNMSKFDQRIQEIKEEYGNKAKLMSMDLLASMQYIPKYSNKELSLFNANNNNLTITANSPNPLRRKSNFFNNNNLNIITNNNLFINRQNNYSNTFLPYIHTYTEKKKDKMMLFFQNNNSVKTYKNNIYKTDLSNISINNDNKKAYRTKSNKNIIIHSLLDKNNNNNNNNNSKILKNKDLSLLNDTFIASRMSIKADHIHHHHKYKSNIIEEKNKTINNEFFNHNIKEIKNFKQYSKDLIIQNIDQFQVDKYNFKGYVIKKINNLAIIKRKVKNNDENGKSNTTTNFYNYNDNPFNIYDLKLIDNEFEKEKNKQNFIIIKKEINKINETNEALNSKINVMEDKYMPIIGQIEEIFKLISLIHDTIKKDLVNQSLATIPNGNVIDSNRIKTDNKLRNKILKSYLNKKGITLTYPTKKINLSIDKNKTKINEENNKSLGNSDFIKIPKDEMNLLLNRIEPFLIKKFSKQ